MKMVKAEDLKPGMRIGFGRHLVTSTKVVRQGIHVKALGGRGAEGRTYPAGQEVQVEA